MFRLEKINETIYGDLAKAFISSWIARYKVEKGDLKDAEAKFKDAIAILEQRAPESSQLMETLKEYGDMLLQAKRSDEARAVQIKAEKIAAQKVTEMPVP